MTTATGDVAVKKLERLSVGVIVSGLASVPLPEIDVRTSEQAVAGVWKMQGQLIEAQLLHTVIR